jgi:hypothetical protein
VWHSPDSLVPPDSSIAEATPDPVPSPRDSVAEAGSAVASLSRLARDETVEQTRMLLPVATAPLQLDGATLPAPLDPSAQSLREAGRGVSEGLQPVTTSARRAWDLFLREVPPAGGSSF